MAEQRESKLENYLKIGGFLIALSGAVLAILQFTSKSDDDPLRDQRIETYKAATRIIGKLISFEKIDSIRAYAPAFMELYNGEMLLVEDPEVAESMKRFKNELTDKTTGVENVVDPFKFKKTGMAAISTFQRSIKKLNSE